MRRLAGSRPSVHALFVGSVFRLFSASRNAGRRGRGPEPGRRGPISRHDRQADQGPKPEDIEPQSRDEKNASGFQVHDHTPVELARIDRTVGR
jgi:hypothetical protein